MANFTDNQKSDWLKYEKVRSQGKYNMLDPKARGLSGLTADRYKFVMLNYSKLKDVVSLETINE